MITNLSNSIGRMGTFELRYKQPKRYFMGLDTTGIVRTGVVYDIDWPYIVTFILGPRLYNSGYRLRFLSLERDREISFGYSQKLSLEKTPPMSYSGLSLEDGDIIGFVLLTLGGTHDI